MTKGTAKHGMVGKQVQIPAYCDLWMQGARHGTIERVAVGRGAYLDPRDPRGATRYGVRMDHPAVKRLAWVIADDCAHNAD